MARGKPESINHEGDVFTSNDVGVFRVLKDSIIKTVCGIGNESENNGASP